MSEQNPRPRTEVTPANEADIQADLRELMIGPNFGAPTDEQRWGLTAQPQGQSIAQPSQAELELQAEIARQAATANALQGLNVNQIPQQQVPDEAAHWRKQYGDSENEKGELRRRLEQVERERVEKEQILNELLQTMQQGGMQQGFGQGGYQQAPQGYQQPNYPSYSGYNGPQPVDPFEGKTDDDIFSVRDAKRLVGEAIGPAMQLMQAQTMQQMDRQTAMSKRAALGLTPTEEFMLKRENPWINGLGSESARVDALASLKKIKVTSAQNTAQTAQAAQAQVAQTAPIVRRLTTVEQSTQQAPDFTGNALNTAFDRDVAAAKMLPEDTGARAKAMRAIAEKYNIPVGKMSDMGLMRTQTIV